ncbi:MAG TPA: hypothetical protein VGM73_08190 [Candidatus Didemnitutus sp.]
METDARPPGARETREQRNRRPSHDIGHFVVFLHSFVDDLLRSERENGLRGGTAARSLLDVNTGGAA